MSRLPALAAATILLGVSVPGAFAQDLPPAVEARQAQFGLLQFNLGTLGAMAKGEMPYEADLATAAADNIAAIATLNQAIMWPEGTSDEAVEGTRAEPAIWENFADFQEKWAALASPAAALVEAAGQGQAAIAPALGPVGQVCGACHDSYRAPR